MSTGFRAGWTGHFASSDTTGCKSLSKSPDLSKSLTFHLQNVGIYAHSKTAKHSRKMMSQRLGRGGGESEQRERDREAPVGK